MGEGQFIAMRADRIVRIRPIVVPQEPPPDREYVDGAAQPSKEAEPVAARKVRKKAPASSPEQREIAIARVTALVKAGETRKRALISVGKELGYSVGALNKWLIESKRQSKGKPAKVANGASEETPRKRRHKSPITSRLMEALTEVLAPIVRDIVAEEIQRRFK